MVDAAPILRMVSLTKQFGRLVAVNDVSLDIQEGEFFTIVGPSGSGKTTLLRMLGGLEKPTAGDIYLRDERVNQVPANRRPTCMVFQSLALFNHKTVGQNIEFSLKMRGESRRARRERGLSLMNVVQLPEDYYDKSVTKCSGGERQRAGADGGVDCPAFERRFTSPARPDGFSEGYLVIRPESMRFLNDPSEAENHLEGSLFNEYALGSRVQYHVSAGGSMFVVEKLREQAYRGAINDDVLIGWDAKDSVLVTD